MEFYKLINLKANQKTIQNPNENFYFFNILCFYLVYGFDDLRV